MEEAQHGAFRKGENNRSQMEKMMIVWVDNQVPIFDPTQELKHA